MHTYIHTYILTYLQIYLHTYAHNQGEQESRAAAQKAAATVEVLKGEISTLRGELERAGREAAERMAVVEHKERDARESREAALHRLALVCVCVCVCVSVCVRGKARQRERQAGSEGERERECLHAMMNGGGATLSRRCKQA